MLLNEGEIDRGEMNKRNRVLYVGESVRERVYLTGLRKR